MSQNDSNLWKSPFILKRNPHFKSVRLWEEISLWQHRGKNMREAMKWREHSKKRYWAGAKCTVRGKPGSASSSLDPNSPPGNNLSPSTPSIVHPRLTVLTTGLRTPRAITLAAGFKLILFIAHVGDGIPIEVDACPGRASSPVEHNPAILQHWFWAAHL